MPGLVNCRRPHIEVSSKEENSGGQHRPVPETHRGRNPAKSIQFGAVVGFAGVNTASFLP
jgi:hypothetical protein